MASSDNTGKGKSSLLGKWLNRKKQAQSQEKIAIGTLVPLSYQQQGLWFLQQLYPENPFYHYAELYRFQGTLDRQALEKSLHDIIARHDILRVSVHLEDGKAVQKSQSHLSWKLEVQPVPDTIHQGQEALYQLAREEARKPFTLAKPPLFRIKLFVARDNLHYLLISAHHIITDKWSMRVLREELAHFYQAHREGKSPNLEILSHQYLDYAQEQRAQPIPEANLNYWKNRFIDDAPKLNLLSDKPRPARPTFKGAYLSRPVDKKIFQSFQEIGGELNTTMYVLFLSAYKILLHRYTEQEDIVVGSPFTNRDQVALEKLIGFFNDTLVLRTQLKGSLSFRELVARVKQTVLEGFSHKNMPFEVLTQSVQTERIMGENPLFQVMFLYHEVPPSPTFPEGLFIDYHPFDLEVSKFDLTLYMEDNQGSLHTIVEYSQDLFQAESMERFLDHWEELLYSIVENSHLAISQLNLLPRLEKQVLLQTWQAPLEPEPPVRNVVQLIEQQVRANPHQIALAYKQQYLSYQELWEKSQALAAVLQKQGVQANTLVGLHLERSLDLGVGILGILLSGAAYLPLDPDYPEERIRYMLHDSEVKFVVCLSLDVEQFLDSPVTPLPIDQVNPELKLAYQAVSWQAEHLAYQIYTSGSTGKPKGVPISHANLAHSNGARFVYYPENPSCFLLMSSFAFDSSIAGIFWTLSSGGKLLISEKRSEQDLLGLSSLIQEEQVSHTLMLPSLYNLLLNLGVAEQLSSLNHVMVAGEACPPQLVASHFEKAPHAKLYNEYGPTEATVWCTVHQIVRDDAYQKVPIGKPVPNTPVYILDEHQQLCPVGVPGQLYIGGPGLSQGYWKRPKLSETKFISHPFEPGTKLYKTGDQARWRTDGLIEFLGRIDEQVKIRGNRVELDEIRSILNQREDIEDVLVLFQDKPKASPSQDLAKESPKALIEALEKLPPEEVLKLLDWIESQEEHEIQSLLNALNKL